MPVQRPGDDTLLVPGPWQHRVVRANGIALHVAELGEGPMIVLIHGFPQFWWTWRQQLVDLAEAGFRAVAVDLRGHGGSDKPPRGYDAPTLTGDVSSLVTALGARDATFVGNGIGGLLAWAAGSLQPAVVRNIVVLGAAHPARLRTSVLRNHNGQGNATRYAWAGFQLPRWPEHRVSRNSDYVRYLFDQWSGPQWRQQPDYPDIVEHFAHAMRVHPVAHCSMEIFRWMVRAAVRSDGRRYMRSLRVPVAAPVLQIHGQNDTCVLPGTARGSQHHTSGDYRWQSLPGVGHFPQEEASRLVSDAIIDWERRH